jgi:DNA-binding Lrp family transcriptional regulator
MPKDDRVDAIDARLLLELNRHPRATTIAIAEEVGIARNTAQTRLARLENNGALGSFGRRITPAALGYRLAAFITAQVTQRELDNVAAALRKIPEVLQVHGISGHVDLLIHVVAIDADDLYRIAGYILAIPGIERTTTALVMRQLVEYRLDELLRRLASAGGSG